MKKKYFHQHTRKRNISTTYAGRVKEKGSICQLTGPAVKSHYDEHKHILCKRRKSRYLIAEIDPNVYRGILKTVKSIQDDRIMVAPIDVFDAFLSPTYGGNLYKYRYMDLDFCKTASSLVRDHNLLCNLSRVASSRKLLSPFYFSITVSTRDASRYALTKNEIIYLVADSFEKNFWSITGGEVEGYRGLNGTPMFTIFFKFNRR